MKKLIILLLFIMVGTSFGQVAAKFRIRMADSTYTAQLRGIAGSRTAGITVQGTYSTTFRAHEFIITTDGRYDLWFDILGGSNYTKDTGYSYTNGRPIFTGNFMDAIDTDFDNRVDVLDDNSVSTGTILNETIQLDDLSPATKAGLNGVTYLDTVHNVGDTSIVKTLGGEAGKIIYLKQISSVNSYGGGFLVLLDSTYSESTLVYGTPYRVVAYPSASAGKQWVRQEYHNNNMVNIEWVGAQPDTTVDSRNFIQAAINYQFDEGGGIVDVPGGADQAAVGMYKVTKGVGIGAYCLEVKQLVVLQGSGAPSSNQGSTIFMAGGQDSAWVIGTSAAVYHDTSGLTGGAFWAHGTQVKDIRINCNGSQQSTFAGGISYDQPGEASRFSNIVIVGARDEGKKGQAGYRVNLGAPGMSDNISVFAYSDFGACGYEFSGSSNTFATLLSGDNLSPAIRHLGGRVNIGTAKLEYNTTITDDTMSVISVEGGFASALKIGMCYVNAGANTKGVGVKIQKDTGTDVPSVDVMIHTAGLAYTYINKATSDTLTEAVAGQVFNGIRTGRTNSYWYMDLNSLYANTKRIQYKDPDGTVRDFAYFLSSGEVRGDTKTNWTWRVGGVDGLQIYSNRIETEFELKTIGGIRIGGDPYTFIDSTTVVADTLLFWSGSTAYKAVKQ